MADFGSFLSNVAIGAGNNIMYQQQQEERQAQLNDLKSQTKARQENSQLLQQDFMLRSGLAQRNAQVAEQKKRDIADINTATQVRDTVETSPTQEAIEDAKMWGQRAKDLWGKGYTAEAELASKEAKRATDQAKEYDQIQKAQKVSRTEGLANAAEDVLQAMKLGGLTPELAKSYYDARAANGQPPSDKDYELDSVKGQAELILAAQKGAAVNKRHESEKKMIGMGEKQDQTRERVEDLHMLTQARIAAIAQKRSGGNSDPVMSDDALKSAGAMAATGMPLTQIMSGTKASGAREAVRVEAIQQIQKDHPELDSTAAGQLLADRAIAYKGHAAASTARARTAGTTVANLEIAGNEARAMVDVAKQYSEKVDSGRFRSLNALENYAASNTGDVPIVQLKASLNSLVNSYARAISPKGSATVSDKQHAREMIDAAMAKGQLSGVFSVMEQEMDAAHKSATKTLGDSGGSLSKTSSSGEGWSKMDGGWSVREKN